MELPVRLLNDDATLPSRANEGDAGLDLHAALGVVIGAGERVSVPTGSVTSVTRTRSSPTSAPVPRCGDPAPLLGAAPARGEDGHEVGRPDRDRPETGVVDVQVGEPDVAAGLRHHPCDLLGVDGAADPQLHPGMCVVVGSHDRGELGRDQRRQPDDVQRA